MPDAMRAVVVTSVSRLRRGFCLDYWFYRFYLFVVSASYGV